MANAREFAVPPRQSFDAVTAQIAGIPVRHPGRWWWFAMAAASALFALYLLSVVVLFAAGVGIWGVNIPVNWGFAILNYVWWLGIGHAGTLISALLLLLGRQWRSSLNRFAEAMTLFAVVCASMYPILHLGRPGFFYWMFPYPATTGVWPQFRSPLEWDIWAILTYFTVSLLFWYTGLIPDAAAARDRTRHRGWRRFFGILALGWRGDARHWRRWRQAYVLIAAIAVPLVVSVHSEVSLLFAVGQQPGWHSTIFPPYFVMGAAFSGFAVVAIIAILLRHGLRLENLVTPVHLDRLAVCILATGLLTAYGYVAEIFFALYADKVYELQTLLDRLTGEHAGSWWGAVIFNFVPLQLLWFRSVRRSPRWLFAVSLSVAVGMWLERYMLVVSGLARDFLVSSWGPYFPSWWEWATFIGTFGLFLVPFLTFVRLVPVISITEVKEELREEELREEQQAAHG